VLAGVDEGDPHRDRIERQQDAFRTIARTGAVVDSGLVVRLPPAPAPPDRSADGSAAALR